MSETFRHHVTVHWGDTDPARIVFYPNYFSWFDQSTALLFRSVGLDVDALVAKYAIVGLPIVEASARFIRPSVFGDEIVVESRIREWRNKTFTLEHVVLNKGEAAVEGSETRVWAMPHPEDASRLKAAPIPPEVIAAFS